MPQASMPELPADLTCILLCPWYSGWSGGRVADPRVRRHPDSSSEKCHRGSCEGYQVPLEWQFWSLSPPFMDESLPLSLSPLALASTAHAARSQWGNGKAVRAQTPQALPLNSLGLGETQ